MSKEINFPLYRAKKKINKKAFAYGILLPKLKRFSMKSFIIREYTRMEDFENAIEIIVETVEISFDSGTTWFSVKCVNSIMNSSEIVVVQE